MQVSSVRNYLDGSKRKRLLHAALWVVLGIVIALMNIKYAYNVFNGPFPMTPKELREIKDPDSLWKNYVTVSGGDNSILTDYCDKEVRKKKYSDEVISEKITDYYQLLPMETGVLLVRTLEEGQAKTFTGEISSIPDDIGTALKTDLDKEQEGLSKALLPAMLTESTSYGALLYTAFFFIGICFFVALIMFFKARSIGGDVLKGNLANSVKPHGNPRDVIAEIDNEFQALGVSNTDAGAIAIGNNWILLPEDSHLRALKISDVVWAFRTQSRESFNFINTNSEALVVYTKDKRKIMVKNSQRNIDTAVAAISVRAPWVYAGYSGKLDIAWQSRPGEIIAEVEENERQYKRSGGPPPVPPGPPPVPPTA